MKVFGRNNKVLIIFIAIIIPYFLVSQTKFDNGFKDGWKKGYCYDLGISCVPPVAPIPPIPSINESRESYLDGYNKGFVAGLNKQRLESSKGTLNRGFTLILPEIIDYSTTPNGNGNYISSNIIVKARNKAKELVDQERFEDCLRLSLEVLKGYPTAHEFMVFAAVCYYKLGDKLNSILYLNKALRIDPSNDQLRGKVHEKFGELVEDAIKDYNEKKFYNTKQKLLFLENEVELSNSYVKYLLGLSYYKIGNTKVATKYLKEAIKLGYEPAESALEFIKKDN